VGSYGNNSEVRAGSIKASCGRDWKWAVTWMDIEVRRGANEEQILAI
jgi:hypothetical protein